MNDRIDLGLFKHVTVKFLDGSPSRRFDRCTVHVFADDNKSCYEFIGGVDVFIESDRIESLNLDGRL